MSKGMEFGFSFGPDRAAQRRPEEAPFRILILGDFSGRDPDRPRRPAAARPIQVTVETLDAALNHMEVRLQVEGAEAPLCLTALDDFHPDQLIRRVGPLSTLADLRHGLLDPRTFETAASGVRAGLGLAPTVTPSPAMAAEGETEAAVLERLLGRPRAAPAPQAGQTTVTEFIKQVLPAGSVAPLTAERDALVAAVDGELTRLMRAILNGPAFRALEAAWRGVDFLLRTIETDEQLEVWVQDVGRSDWGAADAGRLPPDSATAGDWAVILVLHTFAPVLEDIEVLAALARAAFAAGAPALAGADLTAWHQVLEGGATASGWQAWDRLRRLPEAAGLGLLLPRFLLRLPYGKVTDPIETFDFEESGGTTAPTPYLWGHPALIAGSLLAQAFTESGWDMDPDDRRELGDLPVHVFKENGEATMTPCAETWLSEAEAGDWLDAGLMPLCALRGSNALRLERFQSISRPPIALAGGWG